MLYNTLAVRQPKPSHMLVKYLLQCDTMISHMKYEETKYQFGYNNGGVCGRMLVKNKATQLRSHE